MIEKPFPINFSSNQLKTHIELAQVQSVLCQFKYSLNLSVDK